MAYSYVRYTGNGSTTNYTFSFPYISSDHIKVRVNGSLVTNWSFLNTSTIQFAAAPANAAVIEIRRETPKESVIVNFTDGSVLLERDLDLLATYDLYLAQETKDSVDASMTQNSIGVWDGQSKRIANVADPVNAQDAVTKSWAETVYASTLTGHVAAASASASAASTSANNAASSANDAAASASSAASSAAAALTALDNFDDRYLGVKTSNPTLDNDGNALVGGALYFNSVDKVMRVFDGTQWIDAAAAQLASLVTYEYVATSSQTTFSGADANGVTLSYIVGGIIVSLNGVVLRPGEDYTATNGTSVVLVSAATAGDELCAYSFASFEVANTYTKAEVDALKLNAANPSYTGTLTGGTGVVNLGSGQFYKDASGNVGIGTSTPAAGAKLDVNGGIKGTLTTSTSQATTSGTNKEVTGIPAWVKRVTFLIQGVSTNGTSIPILQLGNSGGYETSSYLGTTSAIASSTPVSANHSSGVSLYGAAVAATTVLHGSVTFELIDLATNTWVYSGNVGHSSSGVMGVIAGSKVLGGVLDRIRITTVNGTDAFDAGLINILYEG